MATIYTRVYLANSPRQLVSGKRPAGGPLTKSDPSRNIYDVAELLDEFRNHAVRDSEEPTALVSVGNRIIDALNRAFYLYLKDGEHPSDICIVFIKVPAATSATSVAVHPARPLAEAIGHENPPAFQYEFVFEWAIPEEYVLHEVRLQTLMDRGLGCGDLLGPKLQYVSTNEMRRSIASLLSSTCPHSVSWEIGIYLGGFARKFGARAPSNWIAHQLFHDCVSTRIICDDVVRISDKLGHRAVVGFDFFSELDEGIDVALIDWWLTDYDFTLECEEFGEWREEMEDRMAGDLTDFWEVWNDGVEFDEKSRDVAEHALLAKHEEFKEDIEARAVQLGL